MVAATDIITYVGVPLAIIGVAPIFYTYLKTMIMSFRLRQTLKAYDIEAAVNSRLLSGIVDLNIPTYQLALPPRDRPEYWSHKTTDGSKHGASWQDINWQRRPIDAKTIQVHFSDQIKFPEASIAFADLVYYLGDLGLQTNSEGFWQLAQKGLNVPPGTCLVKEIGKDSSEKPILVSAKPTSEHPGTLLLRFQNKPSKTLRTTGDLDPDWVRVPTVPEMADPAGSSDASGIEAAKSSDVQQVIVATEMTEDKVGQDKLEEAEQEIVEYVRVSRKGFLEKKLVSGVTLPVVGLPFWFVYAMLASTTRNGRQEFNGRPFGYQIRLEYLFFCREISFPLDGSFGSGPSDWRRLIFKSLDAAKVNAIPQAWTEDSPARKNPHLTKRFEILVDSKRRNRAAQLRRPRQKSFQFANEIDCNRMPPYHETPARSNTYLPFEALSIHTAIWSEPAGRVANEIFPLTAHRVPTSQEICVAAMSNMDLASQVGDTVTKFFKWFEGESEGEKASRLEIRDDIQRLCLDEVVLMCAIIIIQAIADGAPYLAALGDVEKCVTKWDPVYLC